MELNINITDAINEDLLRINLYFERLFTGGMQNFNISESSYIWLRVLHTGGGQGGGTI